ncbi:hypothetical protein [Streptomyces sp. NPDC096311]
MQTEFVRYRYFRAKKAQEDLIKASGIPHSIVRPTPGSSPWSPTT